MRLDNSLAQRKAIAIKTKYSGTKAQKWKGNKKGNQRKIGRKQWQFKNYTQGGEKRTVCVCVCVLVMTVIKGEQTYLLDSVAIWRYSL